MLSSSIRWAVVAGAALAATGLAHAAGPADLSKLGPKQQAHLAQIAAKQREIAPMYNYDIKAPVLRAVASGGSINAAIRNVQAVVALTIVDNLAGVSGATVYLRGPSGQQLSGNWSNSFATNREQAQVPIDMTYVGENGTWVVYSVSVQDANGNSHYYDQAAVAALGATSFTIKGATSDQDAPWLSAGGTNLTPVVSRSTPPGGMLPGTPARVGVNLKVSDAGSSGVSSATLAYCSDTGWDCFYLQGTVNVRGKQNVTLTLGGGVDQYTSTGTYTPNSLYLYDHAGNGNYYYGSDISAFIDNATIVVNE